MTTLLVLIYIAFISLGLPDSVLGSAWPVMQAELGAPLSLAGYISMAVSYTHLDVYKRQGLHRPGIRGGGQRLAGAAHRIPQRIAHAGAHAGHRLRQPRIHAGQH